MKAANRFRKQRALSRSSEKFGLCGDMAAALTAAQERIVADAKHADKLAKDLAAATKKLKALEASARRAASTRTTTVVLTSAPSSSSSRPHDDDGDDDEGEHGD